VNIDEITLDGTLILNKPISKITPIKTGNVVPKLLIALIKRGCYAHIISYYYFFVNHLHLPFFLSQK